jgi:hypothetical protein
MSKIIFTFVLFLSLFFSGLSKSAHSTDYNRNSEIKIQYTFEPIELWREYILVGDQWYLIIYYDDGSIGVIPVEKAPLD